MTKPGVVRVDSDIHRRTKIASAVVGKNISTILSEALVDWLAKNKVEIEKEVIKAN